MTIFIKKLLNIRKQLFEVADQNDFFDKGLMENNQNIKNESEFRYYMRINKYIVAIIINVFNVVISTLNPMFQNIEPDKTNSLFQQMVYDLSFILCIAVLSLGILGTVFMMNSQKIKLFIVASYGIRLIISFLLIENQSLRTAHTYSAIVYIPCFMVSFDQKHSNKIIGSSFGVLNLMVFAELMRSIFSIQHMREKDIFYFQIEIVSLIMLFWGFNILNFPKLVSEIHKLQQKNVEYIRIIEENEIHAASLVHELRNPLNSLMGTVTLLEKSYGPKSQQTSEIFNMAKSCGDHLHTLIGNLLEYSKLKAKKIEINKTAIDLKNNIKRILKMNYLKSQEKQNKLNYFISYNFPKKVVTDEQRINQVLINLVSNALKFTEKGQVSVYLGWRPGFSSVTTQEYIDAEKESSPQGYVEQKNIFKAFTENEEEIQCFNSNDSLSEQQFQYAQNLGHSYHYNHYRQNNQTENDYDRIHSNFEFKPEQSQRLIMRSSSDNRKNDNSNPQQKNFSFQNVESQNLVAGVKPFKSEKYTIKQLKKDGCLEPQYHHKKLNVDNNSRKSPDNYQPIDTVNHKETGSSNNNQKFIEEVDEFLLGDQDQSFQPIDSGKQKDQQKINDQRQVQDSLYNYINPMFERSPSKEQSKELKQIIEEDNKNEYDAFDLLEDETQSIQDELINELGFKSKISVRGPLTMKNIPQDNQNEQQINIETLSYGTPKQESITEHQKRIIELVVNNHKKAYSEVGLFQVPELDSLQFIETLREEQISQRGFDTTLNSFKEQFDSRNDFKTKFIHNYQVHMPMRTQNSPVQNPIDQDEQLKLNRGFSYEATRYNDFELLQQSIQQYKKHKNSPNKKRSSAAVMPLPNQVEQIQSRFSNTITEIEKMEIDKEILTKSKIQDIAKLKISKINQKEEKSLRDTLLFESKGLHSNQLAPFHQKKLSLMDNNQFSNDQAIKCFENSNSILLNNEREQKDNFGSDNRLLTFEAQKTQQYTPHLGPGPSD